MTVAHIKHWKGHDLVLAKVHKLCSRVGPDQSAQNCKFLLKKIGTKYPRLLFALRKPCCYPMTRKRKDFELVP